MEDCLTKYKILHSCIENEKPIKECSKKFDKWSECYLNNLQNYIKIKLKDKTQKT